MIKTVKVENLIKADYRQQVQNISMHMCMSCVDILNNSTVLFYHTLVHE